MLKVRYVFANIGENQILRGISLEVGKGKRIAVLGANGAGKTSLIRAITGLLPIQQGHILLNNEPIDRLLPHEIAKLGVSCVPEGRHVFLDMSVLDNLLMGAYLPKVRKQIKSSLKDVLKLFPVLADRLNQRGGTLSGGEQQMLVIGRALMSRPSLLILDELSLGLAPLIVQEIYRILKEIGGKTTLMIVEQNVEQALKNSTYAYILETGQVVRHDYSEVLLQDPTIKQAYLGI